MVDEDVECLENHENVSGSTIFLYKKKFGKSACIQYTVEKDKVPLHQSRTSHFLSAFLLLTSVSVCLSFTEGTLISVSLSIILLYNLVWDIEKEVLLVTVPLGFQFTTFYSSGLQRTCFIPWHCIRDVYITEAISLHRVLYNLVVLTEPEDHEQASPKQPLLKLVPLFQGIKPRLSCLESIYRSIKSLQPEVNSSATTVNDSFFAR